LKLLHAETVDSRLEFWKAYLTSTLGYPKAALAEVKPGVLGVFRDQMRSQCMALVFDARPDQLGDANEELSRQFRAELLVLGAPTDYMVYQVGPYALAPLQGQCLPSWTHGLRRTKPLSRVHVLPPFRDEEHLRKAFSACHDAVYLDSARDPAAAFDLMSLIVAAKVLDERNETNDYYEFARLEDEAPDVAAARLTALLEAARAWLVSDDLSENEIKRVPELRPAVVDTIFRQLQDFSLTSTIDSSRGTDVLGVVYEQMVGATFRGELGSYFTPRAIADFIVRMLGASSGRIFDPSCGSGGLLIAAHRYAKTNRSLGSSPELYGNDLNPRMVEAAKVNFLVHDLDPRQVLHGDGLELNRMVSRWFGKFGSVGGLLWEGEEGPFDFVVANPPFAGHERNMRMLESFETAQRGNGSLRSLNKTLPFLELIVAALREGGSAGVVVPTSILNAEEESFTRFRELLLRHVELKAIIGLPEKAFVHTDCGVHGALIFFQRCLNPRAEYDVFVGWAEHLGYDRLGRTTLSSDFPGLVDAFVEGNWRSENRVPVSILVNDGRWDPSWLRLKQHIPTVDPKRFVALTELVEVRDARWSRKQLRDDQTYVFFEVNDADLHSGVVRQLRSASGFELSRKGRIRQQVSAGDILLPNHRDSLMASSAANGRSVVVVDDRLNGALTTDRFLVLRPKISPRMAEALLNSRGVRRQLIAQCRGAASLEVREGTLANVLVPVELLEESKQGAISALMELIGEKRQALEATQDRLDQEVEQAFGMDEPIRPVAAR
jgi:hypothetical protein